MRGKQRAVSAKRRALLCLCAAFVLTFFTSCTTDNPYYSTTTTKPITSATTAKDESSDSAIPSENTSENTEATSARTDGSASPITSIAQEEPPVTPENSDNTTAATKPPVSENTSEKTTSVSITSTSTEKIVTTTTTEQEQKDPSPAVIRKTVASGTKVSKNEKATIDYSNVSDGYVMVRYTGTHSNIRLRITAESGLMNTYVLDADGGYEAFPIFDGDGKYKIVVYENDGGTSYATAHQYSLDANLSNEFTPFLYPTKYIEYDENTIAVKKAEELCAGTDTDLERLDAVYGWIVENITYDKVFASSMSTNYYPDVDNTYNTKKGICIDYSSLACAMLRSQNIPVKLAIGWSGTAYHAWIVAYTQKQGWIYSTMYFDGNKWVRLDCTYAASAKSSDYIVSYINNDDNSTITAYN